MTEESTKNAWQFAKEYQDPDFRRVAAIAITDFKEALRSAIEKQIKYHEDTGPMAQESRSTEIGELKRFLLLIDSVTPKE